MSKTPIFDALNDEDKRVVDHHVSSQSNRIDQLGV